MTQREVITEAMLQAAIAALNRRIAMPPLPAEISYSRREAFAKLRGKAKKALAAGHTLETVLDDLKGVGLGMTISTARQYLKPGRKTSKGRGGVRLDAQVCEDCSGGTCKSLSCPGKHSYGEKGNIHGNR